LLKDFGLSDSKPQPPAVIAEAGALRFAALAAAI
jgi:hypothetical protein